MYQTPAQPQMKCLEHWHCTEKMKYAQTPIVKHCFVTLYCSLQSSPPLCSLHPRYSTRQRSRHRVPADWRMPWPTSWIAALWSRPPRSRMRRCSPQSLTFRRSCCGTGCGPLNPRCVWMPSLAGVSVAHTCSANRHSLQTDNLTVVISTVFST